MTNTVPVQLGQAESTSVNYSYSELSYVSAKTDSFATRPRQLRFCIESNNATDIELHVHTYAVGIGDIAAREGSPHNVLHSSSLLPCIIS